MSTSEGSASVPEDMKTPVNKRTKKKLKKVPKNLNSIGSANKSINFSFLNNTAIKQSLRANNRALAQNLQRTRHDLKMAVQEIVELQRRNKELEMRVLSLERVAGLQDAEIEMEVQRRLQETAMGMVESEVQLRTSETYRKLKQLMMQAGESLYAAASNITEALNECADTSRRSTISSFQTFRRGKSGSSIGSLGHILSEEEHEGKSPSPKRLQSQAVPESDVPLHPAHTDSLPLASHDMSVILEQPTMIMDTTVVDMTEDNGPACIESVPEEIPEETVEETDTNAKGKKKGLSKLPLPQRVPRKASETGQQITDNGPNKSQKSVAQDEVSSSSSPAESAHEVQASKSDSAVTMAAKNRQPIEDDRRKTFVVPSQKTNSPKMVEKGRRETFVVEKESSKGNQKGGSDNRRGTFVLPQKTLQDTLPEVNFPESSEQTIILNTDMEMTEVVNFTQQISLPNSPSQSSDKGGSKLGGLADTERSRSDTDLISKEFEELKKRVHKADKPMEEGESKEDKQTRKDGENVVKSAVECRVTKPGRIVFSATRKDIDGFRKPVPVKKPKGKSTIKLSKDVKSLKGHTTPAKTGSVFDFHDKTPNVHTEKSLGVYDISMNESVAQDSKKKGMESEGKIQGEEPKSKKGARTKDKKNTEKAEAENKEVQEEMGKMPVKEKAATSNPEVSELEDGMIYRIPLKDSSPDKPALTSRSRSRGRKSYKEYFNDSDAESPAVEVKRRGRSKSRGRKAEDDDDDFVPKTQNRGRSKHRGSINDNEEEEEKLNTKRSKSRARSCTRKTAENEDVQEEVVENAQTERRGRSRHRNAREEEKKEESPEVKDRRKSRGRSRSRKLSKSPKGSGSEDRNIITRASRSKSRTIILDSDEEDKSPEVKLRSKSRGRSRTCKEKEKSDEESKVDGKSVQRRLRSKSRARSRSEQLDVQNSTEDESSTQGKSLSRRSERHKTNQPENNPPDQQETNQKETEPNIELPTDDYNVMIADESPVELITETSDENEDGGTNRIKKVRKSSSRRKSTYQSESDECIDIGKLKEAKSGKDEGPVSSNGNEQRGSSLVNGSDSKDEKRSRVSKSPEITKSKPNEPIPKATQKDVSTSRTEHEEKQVNAVGSVDSVSDRLTFVCGRDRTKEVQVFDDDELTFSDFDKMYKAKRTLSDFEKEKEAKRNAEKQRERNTGEEEVPKEKSSKSVKKRKLQSSSQMKICETPNAKDVVAEFSPVKSKAKKSSKKAKKDTEILNGEKENEQVQSGKDRSSFTDKLKKINERISMMVEGNRLTGTEDSRESIATSDKPVLSDVGNQMSGLATPSVGERVETEPSAKRSCRRAGQVSYKEVPLNKKMRRGDAFLN